MDDIFDEFCVCAGGRRVGGECGEVLCRRVGLPPVRLVVSGDVARGSGRWCLLHWRVYAERIDSDRVRGQVRVARAPGARASMVADVTVHVRDGTAQVWSEAQSVLAAILWSRLRAGWLESDQ